MKYWAEETGWGGYNLFKLFKRLLIVFHKQLLKKFVTRRVVGKVLTWIKT